MRLLLDTHIALWAVTEPERLTENVRTLIIDPANEVAASIVSLWEIGIKRSSARAAGDTPQLSAEAAGVAFANADFDLIAISIAQLEIVATLPFHHRDPFDRLIVATAVADRYRLLTRDKTLAAYGDFVMLV